MIEDIKHSLKKLRAEAILESYNSWTNHLSKKQTMVIIYIEQYQLFRKEFHKKSFKKNKKKNKK